MAVTLINGTRVGINATDPDATQIDYTVVSQPGSDISGFTVTSNLSTDPVSPITGVAKGLSLWALQGGAGTITVNSVSLKEKGTDTELLTDPELNDATNQWTLSNATDNGGSVTLDGTSQYGELAQDIALTAGVTYVISVNADIPSNTTLRLESYHYDTVNGNADPGFYQDYVGAGSGSATYTFEFRPSETTILSGVPSATLNGGPGSPDYGTNNTTSKSYVMSNTFSNVENNVTIRATDQDGQVAERTYKIRTSLPWRFLSNLTHGYVAGGYYSAESWRTVCKCNMSTDTTASLGTKMASNGVTSPNGNRSGMRYADASTDRWTGQGLMCNTMAYDSSNYTESFNMITDSTYNNNAQLANTHNYGQNWSDDTRRIGWTGGGAVSLYEKINMTTMTRVGQVTGYVAQAAHGAWFTETHGYTYTTDNSRESMAFATETRTTASYDLGSTAHSTNTTAHTKCISTYGFGQNEAWLVGWNVVTNTSIVRHSTGTAITGPAQTTNNGEGNCVSGPVDSHGYSLGGYNGTPQNNHADKMNYATYTINRVSAADLRPHAGASSGGCMWAEI
jgi:hypothetical protein